MSTYIKPQMNTFTQWYRINFSTKLELTLKGYGAWMTLTAILSTITVLGNNSDVMWITLSYCKPPTMGVTVHSAVSGLCW